MPIIEGVCSKINIPHTVSSYNPKAHKPAKTFACKVQPFVFAASKAHKGTGLLKPLSTLQDTLKKQLIILRRERVFLEEQQKDVKQQKKKRKNQEGHCLSSSPSLFLRFPGFPLYRHGYERTSTPATAELDIAFRKISFSISLGNVHFLPSNVAL